MLMSGVRVAPLHILECLTVVHYCTTHPWETALHLQFKSPAEKSCVVLNGNDISQTECATYTSSCVCVC